MTRSQAVSIPFVLWLAIHSVQGAVEREMFALGSNCLTIEVLDDDLVHFQIAPGAVTGVVPPIPTTPMVFKTDYAGPSSYSKSGAALETPQVRVEVNPVTLVVTIFDKTKTPQLHLTSLSPHLGQDWKGLVIEKEGSSHVYGLGEQFVASGSSDGDWVNRARTEGPYGNEMATWNGGAVGNCQFPIAYFLGEGSTCYALFMDDPYREQWSFVASPWKVETTGDSLRWYVMTGSDLPDLRKDFLELVGRPPVPPKKAFGLWVSEYGFDGWNEIKSKLDTLRQNQFPIDGFVLDLQWFGNVQGNSDDSRMGTLTWDTTAFPNPAGRLADLAQTEGIGVITIEESYISKDLPEHHDLEQKGYLVRQSQNGPPVYLTQNPW